MSTLNLVVVGTATLGAAALHSFPMLALGGVAYATLVAWDLVNPKFWSKANQPEPLMLPKGRDLTDAGLREVVRVMTEGRQRLDDVLADTPDTVKQHLGSVLASMNEIEASAARLVIRAEELTCFLATTDPGPVRTEIQSLMQRAATARDEGIREQYENARAIREEQLRTLDDIAAARERAMANLARMTATLEGLPPKIVRMRVLDAQALDALTGTLSDELEIVNSDLKLFEEALKSLGDMNP